jgi:uncharacterized protein YjiS (DUF1127 family)
MMITTPETDRAPGLAMRLWRMLPRRRRSAPGLDGLSDHILADIGITRVVAEHAPPDPAFEALRYSG